MLLLWRKGVVWGVSTSLAKFSGDTSFTNEHKPKQAKNMMFFPSPKNEAKEWSVRENKHQNDIDKKGSWGGRRTTTLIRLKGSRSKNIFENNEYMIVKKHEKYTATQRLDGSNKALDKYFSNWFCSFNVDCIIYHFMVVSMRTKFITLNYSSIWRKGFIYLALRQQFKANNVMCWRMSGVIVTKWYI